MAYWLHAISRCIFFHHLHYSCLGLKNHHHLLPVLLLQMSSLDFFQQCVQYKPFWIKIKTWQLPAHQWSAHSFSCNLEKNRSFCSILQRITGFGPPTLVCPHLLMLSHSLILLQPHVPCSSRNTHSQLPQVDSSHLLNPLPGSFSPQIYARLAFSLPSDLYSNVTSSDRSSLTTLFNIAQCLSVCLSFPSSFPLFLLP